jgi:hypothetical protein
VSTGFLDYTYIEHDGGRLAIHGLPAGSVSEGLFILAA